jgi:hypothetical protein
MTDLKFDHHTLVRVKENYLVVSRDKEGQDMFAIGGDGEKIAEALVRQYRMDGRVAFVIDAVIDDIHRTEKIEKHSYAKDFLLGLLLLIFIVAVWFGVAESVQRKELFRHKQEPAHIVRDSAQKNKP